MRKLLDQQCAVVSCNFYCNEKHKNISACAMDHADGYKSAKITSCSINVTMTACRGVRKRGDSFTVLLQFVSRYKEKLEMRELLTLIVNALGGSEFISPCNHSDIYAGIKSISIDCERERKSLTLELCVRLQHFTSRVSAHASRLSIQVSQSI